MNSFHEETKFENGSTVGGTGVTYLKFGGAARFEANGAGPGGASLKALSCVRLEIRGRVAQLAEQCPFKMSGHCDFKELRGAFGNLRERISNGLEVLEKQLDLKMDPR